MYKPLSQRPRPWPAGRCASPPGRGPPPHPMNAERLLIVSGNCAVHPCAKFRCGTGMGLQGGAGRSTLGRHPTVTTRTLVIGIPRPLRSLPASAGLFFGRGSSPRHPQSISDPRSGEAVKLSPAAPATKKCRLRAPVKQIHRRDRLRPQPCRLHQIDAQSTREAGICVTGPALRPEVSTSRGGGDSGRRRGHREPHRRASG